jgi:hypothetical protein
MAGRNNFSVADNDSAEGAAFSESHHLLRNSDGFLHEF